MQLNSVFFSVKNSIKMIPPNVSLVKYDNPVLVSRNTDKKTPRVSVLLTQNPLKEKQAKKKKKAKEKKKKKKTHTHKTSICF